MLHGLALPELVLVRRNPGRKALNQPCILGGDQLFEVLHQVDHKRNRVLRRKRGHNGGMEETFFHNGGGGDAPPGQVSFYKVQRRIRTLQGQQTEDWGAWQATTTDTEINLSSLTRGVEYDFRILASNASGDSTASNVVTVVL
jgi:hypothetical protein